LQTEQFRFTQYVFHNRTYSEQNSHMRIALYARVSTKDKQEAENQLAQLREFARTQGWVIVNEYVDRITGKHSDRAQFQKLFHDAAQRRFDLVLFWALDRFSREGVSATLQHLERLTSYGVNWRSFTEQYLDSCGIFKDAVMAILAVVAKQERIRLSERTLAGLARARREGKRLGRPRLVVDRDRVAALHQKGWSVRAIAAEVATSPASVCRMLKSRRLPEAVPHP
jgi:DNA invertase Pin-like site-specific DNA recombinase